MKKIEISVEQAEEISQIVTMVRRQIFWETDKAISRCKDIKEVQTALLQKYGEDGGLFDDMLNKIFTINIPGRFGDADIQA